MIFEALIGLLLALQGFLAVAKENKTESSSRDKKVLSVFNIVTFPNSACGASSGYNGTCYTASECTTQGGTASGTCASSFGVCCVFNLACGGSTTQNNSYAIITEYSTSSDKDPCSYTICRQNTDICKLRIDFDTMVLADPYTTTTLTAAAEVANGPRVGDCIYDTLTITNPGGSSPPIICGYNTGQHMFVPASETCNTINIDIDTGTTTTTRKWQIKVSQFACGNMMAPEQDCLQYFTKETGTIATFNWDTTTTTIASTQVHLSNQYYDICVRRQRSYCSLCLSPQVLSTADDVASSYGLGSSSVDAAAKNAVGTTCTGITSQAPTSTGYGDYIEIANLQATIGSSGTIGTNSRVCGGLFNAGTASIQTTQATACTFAVPFKIGVHFDDGEVLINANVDTTAFTKGENVALTDIVTGAGLPYSGFWFAYWQNSC